MYKKTISTLVFSVATAAASSTAAFAADENQLEIGKALFTGGAQPIACAVCHTLDDAGTTGTIGPNLDELQPDADRIRKTMMEGMGAMPSFADSLSEDEHEAVIQYVLTATGQN